MSFLFPLYILGAAAIAVPILLHLRRRPPKEHIPFSSLMFLEKTPERLTRRTRLEKLLLLALRCLAIILLALAFSRPFLRSMNLTTESASFTRAIILVDRSASMQREDLSKQALTAAEESLERFDEKDEVAFAFFDESMEMAADFPAWKNLGARARKSQLEETLSDGISSAGWLGTDVGKALTRASDMLLAADLNQKATEREIILISDFQKGADLDVLNQSAWPEDVNVRAIPVSVKSPGNMSITLAATPTRSNIDEEELYRVRISNAADSESSDVTLSWQGFPDTAISTTIAPGTSRILSSRPRPAEAEKGILSIQGDAHSFDNEVYISPVQPRPLRILFANPEGAPETPGTPLFYLRRAMQPTPALNPVITTTEELDNTAMEDREVIVLSGTWGEEMSEKARGFAQSGGLVLAIPGEGSSSGSFATLTDGDWKLSEADVSDYALFSDLDFEHPVLLPFARAQVRDFTKIRIWKHRLLEMGEADDSGAQVIATFDGESPALFELPVGEGAVFGFLSGWEPKESQLSLSSKFVPLLYSIFDHAGYSIRSAPTLYVGETEHQKPGFYEETKGDEQYLVSVNLAPAEGMTASFDPVVTLAEYGIPLLETEQVAEQADLPSEVLARLESEEKENRQKLWKWLILLALILLIIETWLAGRRAGGKSVATSIPTATPS